LKIRGRNNSPNLVCGPDPIISNKYWSVAMQEVGYNSKTLMAEYYSINKKSDFNLYYLDFFSFASKIPIVKFIFNAIKPLYIFLYSIIKFDIFHIPAHGYVLRTTLLQYFEAQLLHIAGKKIIVLPYGSDFYRYSKVYDLSLRNGLLKSYPMAALKENKVSKNFNYWIINSDIFIPFFQTDGTGRWDSLPFSAVVINEKDWNKVYEYSLSNGKNRKVIIVHTPNHRGFKGSEFIINAIEELKREGLQIELILIENKPNEEVKAILQKKADILIEQIIATGYALSAIEGMACSLPVLSNLDSEYYTRVFRRYSFLNECPILSTTPESIKYNLKILIENPLLRKALGKAGRAYVEKYHSFKSAQFLFSKIYDKIWDFKEIDLMNLYHPLNESSYNNKYPKVNHPLFENKLKGEWSESLEEYV
jgi:glycosyltransferase involved in cell wall biosynthesis